MLKSQARFATKLAQPKRKRTSNPLDVPLSDEMSSWLHHSLTDTDEHGYLPEAVGSSLTQPLDSFSAFCPTGSLLHSKFSSVRMPNSTLENESTLRSASSTGHTSIGEELEERPEFRTAVNRLNVMWLNRKAALEKEDGEYERSLNTLQEAIDLHIGPGPYENCRIADPVGTSNPEDLLSELADHYFPYDSTAHCIADRIQRWYHRIYKMKTKCANLIQKNFRRYIDIRNNWRHLQVQIQCAKKLQRRFRVHLKRMNCIAAFLQAWYRMKAQVRKFNVMMRFFRAAKNIQRVQRGLWGRRIATRKHLQREMARKLQRNARGYMARQRRAWALKQYHKIFYFAALKLQCLFRRIIAVNRCKRRLLDEIIREDRRMDREKGIRDETVQIEMDRTRLYLETDAGKLHLESCKQKIMAEDDEFNKNKPFMTPEEILARDGLVIFEVYDNDGSGTIDRDELKFMLMDLCVPMNDPEVEVLIGQLDADGSGDIDFEEFIHWYSSGGGDESSSSIGGLLIKQMLKARRLMLDFSGETLRRRAHRAVLRQCCSWLSNETKSLFRTTQPPKYNCCRCLEPFVLFSDYMKHFKGHGDTRLCKVTGENAFFYPKFWIQRDWKKQRQCEAEVMRVTYEYPCLVYKSMLAVYAELAIITNPGVASMLKSQVESSSLMYMDRLEKVHNEAEDGAFYASSLPSFIFDIANICDDGFLSPNIAKCVAGCLKQPLPTYWIIQNKWSLHLFREWLEDLDVLKRPQSTKCCGCCNSPLTVMRKDSVLLANLYVRCIRLLLVGAETSLISLAEYRLKRPRKMRISDTELKKKRLQMLTKESYDTVRVKLIKRLRIIRESLRKLQAFTINYMKAEEELNVIPHCMLSCKRKLGLKYSLMQSDEDPTDEEIESYEYESAHVRAQAYFYSRQRTKIGKAQVRRADRELWARRRHITDKYRVQYPQDYKTTNQRLRAQLDYLFSFFCIAGYNSEGVHAKDTVLLLEKYFNMKIPDESVSTLLSVLDPHQTGFVSKDSLLNWLLSDEQSHYRSTVLKIRNRFNLNICQRDAKMNILCDIRRIARLEIESQKASLKAIDTLLKASEGENFDEVVYAKTVAAVGEDDEAQSLEETVKSLKLQFDKQEQRVLARISENDAERCTKLQMVLTMRGRYFWKTEELLLKLAQTVVHSYGEAIPRSLRFPPKKCDVDEEYADIELGYLQCLSVLVHCFDTDCSGSFDESEITLLLECVRDSLSEKRILYHFPDVVMASSSLQQVLVYLLSRVHWRRKFLSQGLRCRRDIEIGTLPYFYSSALLLISLSRQCAREKSDQAAQLTKTGVLVGNGDDSGFKEISGGLLMRTQLLAMRQVELFLRTPYGRMRQYASYRSLQNHWRVVVGDGFSRISLIQYAFHVHKIDSGDSLPHPSRMLNSELPHLIRFIATRFKWTVKETECVALSRLSSCSQQSDARWILLDEAIEIIDNAFQPTESGLSGYWSLKCLKSDGRLRLMSVARQQSFLIAIDFPEKDVKETNYRCFIIGVFLLIKFKNHDNSYADSPIDWNAVPSEAMLVYLLSQGFTLADLIDSNCIEGGAEGGPSRSYYQSKDNIRYDDIVNPDEVLADAVAEIFSQMSCGASVDRLMRYMGGIAKFYLYKKIVTVLTLHREEVNYLGRMFLNEIVTGVSHCTFE